MRKIAVIGGGMAGLSCATELAQHGLAVEVFECEAQLGGRMRTRVRNQLAFDLGANFFVGAYREVLELARAHGVELVRPGPTEHAVFSQGKPRVLHFAPQENLFRADCLSLWSRLRLLVFLRRLRNTSQGDFFDLSSIPVDWNRRDAYSEARRSCGRQVADTLIEGFHDTMMFYPAHRSAGGLLRSLLSALSDPNLDFGVVHPYGHMQCLADALGARLKTHAGCRVTALIPLCPGWKVEWSGHSAQFDTVVLATTAGAAQALIPERLAAHRAVAGATRYATTINLAFSIPLGSLGATHCFYLPAGESELICEMTNESNKGLHASHAGRSLVTVGLHDQAARQLYSLSDEAIFARVKGELLRLLPDLWSEQVRPHDLQRWAEAIPIYQSEQIARVRDFLLHHQGREEFYLCGDYLNAPWLEGACRSGKAAATQIVRAQQEECV